MHKEIESKTQQSVGKESEGKDQCARQLMISYSNESAGISLWIKKEAVQFKMKTWNIQIRSDRGIKSHKKNEVRNWIKKNEKNRIKVLSK